MRGLTTTFLPDDEYLKGCRSPNRVSIEIMFSLPLTLYSILYSVLY